MRLTIRPTAEIRTHHGVPVRVWLGADEHGAFVQVLVAAVGVDASADHEAFERELVALDSEKPS